MEGDLQGQTEVLGGNLPQCQIFHHKSHRDSPGTKPGTPRWETCA